MNASEMLDMTLEEIAIMNKQHIDQFNGQRMQSEDFLFRYEEEYVDWQPCEFEYVYAGYSYNDPNAPWGTARIELPTCIRFNGFFQGELFVRGDVEFEWDDDEDLNWLAEHPESAAESYAENWWVRTQENNAFPDALILEMLNGLYPNDVPDDIRTWTGRQLIGESKIFTATA